MIGGSIARLARPADRPLETASASGSLPAIEVHTQTSLDGDAVAQHGEAAGEISDTEIDVSITGGSIHTRTVDTSRIVATSWVADVLGAGFVAAESVQGSGDYAFPFNLVSAQTGRQLEDIDIDIPSLAKSWEGDQLRDTWMVGGKTGDAVSIDYHGDTNEADLRGVNIGLGFELSWNNTIAKGVIYQSGYVAIWEDWTPSMFCEFVELELLPHAFVPDEDGEGTEQTRLDDAGDAHEYVEGVCDECGHERSKTTVDENGDRVCILCEESVTGGASADD